MIKYFLNGDKYEIVKICNVFKKFLLNELLN